MPRKGKSRVTPAQRAKIAAGRVSGKTGKQIAEETGLAHSTVKKQAADDRTRTLVQEAKDENRDELLRLYGTSLKVVGKALRSKDTDLALRAVARLQGLISVGDPPLARLLSPSEAPPNSMLLEEYLELYRKFETGEINGTAPGQAK